MLASKALRRSRIAMEMASLPDMRATPSGRTRCIDSSRARIGSVQKRHQPADSHPRNCASTGAARPVWGAEDSAQIVIGMDNNPSNVAAGSQVDPSNEGMDKGYSRFHFRHAAAPKSPAPTPGSIAYGQS